MNQMRRLLAIFTLGFILSVFIYPASLFYPSSSLPDDNDTRLLSYIIGSVQNNLINHKPLFQATFFAPYENTLTYSDPFISTALLTLPARLLTDNPIIIFNLAYLLNSSLTFLAVFILISHLAKSTHRGIFGSTLFTLSGFHLTYLPHLQIYSIWASVLAIYFFIRFQETNKSIFINLFYLATLLQLADSPFPAYLVFFACLIIYINKPTGLKKIIVSGIPFAICSIILIYPYLVMNSTFPESSRPIKDAAHFSLGLEEIFTKYRSWTVIVLLLLSLIIKSKVTVKPYLAILVTSLILSLGPVVKLAGKSLKILSLPLPLPYSLFYYFFPGFKGFRTPSRFIVLALLAAAIIVSLRLPKRAVFVSLLAFCFLLYEANLPRLGYSVDPTPPAVYETVKTLPNSALILELPILLWNQPNHEIESLRSLYSLNHQKRRLGGYSGFAPRSWISLVESLNSSGLSAENLTLLRQSGVTHVVENNSLFPLPSQP